MSSFTNDQRNANEDNNIFSLSFKLIKIKKKTLNLILLIAAKGTKRLTLLFSTGRGWIVDFLESSLKRYI